MFPHTLISQQQDFHSLLCRAQQKKLTGGLKNIKNVSCFCAFLQILILQLVFNCPRLVSGVSKENAVGNLVPGHVMEGGLAVGCKPQEG